MHDETVSNRKGNRAVLAMLAIVAGCGDPIDAPPSTGADANAPSAVAEHAAATALAAREGAAWPPAECDDVYELRAHGADGTSPYAVPAGAERHPRIYHDAPWPAGSQAIALKPLPDNESVVRHWILYSGIAFLSSWAPGENAPFILPPDVGLELPTGARSLSLDMDYDNARGPQAERDRSGVAICTVRGAKARTNVAAVFTGFYALAAGAAARPGGSALTSSCRVVARTPITLLTAGPHAHEPTTHVKLTVGKVDGQQIVMHDRPFSARDEGVERLAPAVVLDTGDTVTTTCLVDRPLAPGGGADGACFNFALYYPKGALRCGL